jgi:fused signal recognition particle receptor
MGFFEKLKTGLGKTKNSIDEKINNVFSVFRKVDEDLLDELEEVLVMSDIGMETSIRIINELRTKIKKEKIENEDDVKAALKEIMREILDVEEPKLNLETKPSVILVVGVNGVGKTTSIGKIANNLVKDGKKVVIAAADTFRAAAVEQLEVWAKRSNSIIVKKEEGADPASVVFDAIRKAKEEKYDVLICDTAGRLHNKKYLMDELDKIQRVIEKELPNSDKEVLLVIDATTGQNAISQVKAFKEVAPITGLVLTKLDGTAKGGIVLAIKEEVGLPVKFIGLGETKDDLQTFDIEKYIYGLFKDMM